jgi:hypothetical protein
MKLKHGGAKTGVSEEKLAKRIYNEVLKYQKKLGTYKSGGGKYDVAIFAIDEGAWNKAFGANMSDASRRIFDKLRQITNTSNLKISVEADLTSDSQSILNTTLHDVKEEAINK